MRTTSTGINERSHTSRLSLIVSAVLLLSLPLAILAQEAPVDVAKTDIQKARDIKLQRIAVTWYLQPIELYLNTGEVESGKLMIFEQGEFRLNTAAGLKNIPSRNVKSLVLKKQKKDLLLVGLTSLGGAGLFAAATSLSTNSDPGKVTAAALLGAAGGFALGWKFFFQDVTIKIE